LILIAQNPLQREAKLAAIASSISERKMPSSEQKALFEFDPLLVRYCDGYRGGRNLVRAGL
jgi:hypothetical protein